MFRSRLVRALLVLVALLLVPASAQATQLATPTVGHEVIMRGGPDASTSVISTLPVGRFARVQDSVDGWKLLAIDGETGWAKADALRTLHEATPSCTTSTSIGSPSNGHLRKGVLFPHYGVDFVAWNWRTNTTEVNDRARWGSCRMVKKVYALVRKFRTKHPDSAPVVIGDLSLRRGGEIDGHSTHENGLQIDLYYPRKDRQMDEPKSYRQVDKALTNALLREILASGAKQVLVGHRTPVKTSRKVSRYPNHENHFHVIF